MCYYKNDYFIVIATQPRSILVSVVFVLNVSPNVFTPSSPISLAIKCKNKNKVLLLKNDYYYYY